MLVEPEVFIKESKKIGCSRQEFLICANDLTNRPEIIEQLKSIGQGLYYKIDYNNKVLAIVTVGNKTLETSEAMYSEVFKTIRHFAH